MATARHYFASSNQIRRFRPVALSFLARRLANLPTELPLYVQKVPSNSFVMTILPLSPTGRGFCAHLSRNSFRKTNLRKTGEGGGTLSCAPTNLSRFGTCSSSPREVTAMCAKITGSTETLKQPAGLSQTGKPIAEHLKSWNAFLKFLRVLRASVVNNFLGSDS